MTWFGCNIFDLLVLPKTTHDYKNVKSNEGKEGEAEMMRDTGFIQHSCHKIQGLFKAFSRSYYFFQG